MKWVRNDLRFFGWVRNDQKWWVRNDRKQWVRKGEGTKWLDTRCNALHPFFVLSHVINKGIKNKLDIYLILFLRYITMWRFRFNYIPNTIMFYANCFSIRTGIVRNQTTFVNLTTFWRSVRAFSRYLNARLLYMIHHLKDLYLADTVMYYTMITTCLFIAQSRNNEGRLYSLAIFATIWFIKSSITFLIVIIFYWNFSTAIKNCTKYLKCL